MKDGFLKISAALPDIRVGDVENNLNECIKEAKALSDNGAGVVVFPELSLTGATCGDMLYNAAVLGAAKNAVGEFARATAEMKALFVLGAPIALGTFVYSCAVVIKSGKVIAIVPLSEIDGAIASMPENLYFDFCGSRVPFSKRVKLISIGVSDFSAVILPAGIGGAGLAYESGANLIIIPAAEPHGVGFSADKRDFARVMARELGSAVIYAGAGIGESGAEGVYSGTAVIADNFGRCVSRAPFSKEETSMVVDFAAMEYEKRRRFGKRGMRAEVVTLAVDFDVEECEVPEFKRTPFVPEDEGERRALCSDAFEIQAEGLAARFERSYSKSLVVGISGGLDSTLAILVMARAVDILKAKGKAVDRSAIKAITMPCFGTTARTKSNAEKLSELLGATVRCIDIKAAVSRHFEDIGHDRENYNVVYENAQARERTQVLMDIANAEGGLVVGTGDLSEAALGWATYNGDHMSMYGVNATVPKTLVRAIVENYAEECENAEISAVLRDILLTPVSPELLPPKDGEIAQCTEGIVGPYELHDFFLYHFVKHGTSPEKLYRIAASTFSGVYGEEVVRGWCKVFLRRFVTQQFKRSCTPDAPSIGIISLSPRGAWRMPSDFSPSLFTLG